MKRYATNATSTTVHPEGRWVKHEDHQKETAKLLTRKSRADKLYPVFDRLEEYLSGGAYIAHQDGEWLLCNPDGSSIASGKTIREMLVNFIFITC